MKHLNFDQNTINLMTSYLDKRKQATEINTHLSKILTLGPYSVAQGSVLSGVNFVIFSLDIHNISHNVIHNNDTEYNFCSNPNNTIYVDDTFSIIQ